MRYGHGLRESFVDPTSRDEAVDECAPDTGESEPALAMAAAAEGLAPRFAPLPPPREPAYYRENHAHLYSLSRIDCLLRECSNPQRFGEMTR